MNRACFTVGDGRLLGSQACAYVVFQVGIYVLFENLPLGCSPHSPSALENIQRTPSDCINAYESHLVFSVMILTGPQWIRSIKMTYVDPWMGPSET